MDLESLKIFTVVAAELNITGAASRLGRAPSNVTTRIQQLEAELAAQLFVRLGRRFTLSTAGERFLGYAQRMLALEEEARHVVSGGADGGSLRLGSMESVAASRLPAPLARYHKAHPATRLELSTDSSMQLLEQVRKGRLDCAFVALPAAVDDHAMLEELGLSGKKIWTEELLLLLPAGLDPAAKDASAGHRSLAAFKQGCTYRALAEKKLAIAGNVEWTVHEFNSYHAMIACVAAGASISVLPKSVLELAKTPTGLQTRSLGFVDTYLVWRSGYSIAAFDNFLTQLEQESP